MSTKSERQNQPSGWARFLALWTASGANYFAYGAMKLVLALVATRLTRSPLLISGIGIAQILPALFLGLPAGSLVDRYDRRLILLITTAFRMAAFVLAALVILAGFLSLPLLYTLAFALGVTETIEEPALAAAIPLVVPHTKLERANTFLSGAQNIIGLLADPLGGFFASISVALSMSAGGFFAAISLVALLCVRGALHPLIQKDDIYPEGRKATQVEKGLKLHHLIQRSLLYIGTEVLEGLSYLWNERLLLTISLMAGVINACWEGYLVIMVLYAVAPGPLGLTAPAYGTLLASMSAGSIIGAFLTIPVQRWLGKRWAISLNIFGNGLMFLTPSLTHNLWLIGGAMLVGSMGGPMWTIAAAALQGRIVPPELQGRVNATYRVLSIGTSALGPIFGGLLAQVFGLPIVLALFGMLTWLQFIPFFWVVTERAMMRTR